MATLRANRRYVIVVSYAGGEKELDLSIFVDRPLREVSIYRRLLNAKWKLPTLITAYIRSTGELPLWRHEHLDCMLPYVLKKNMNVMRKTRFQSDLVDMKTAAAVDNGSYEDHRRWADIPRVLLPGHTTEIG